jgi:hypothetical protein
MKAIIKPIPGKRTMPKGQRMRFEFSSPGFVATIRAECQISVYQEKGKGRKKYHDKVELWMWESMARIISVCDEKAR